MYFIPILLVCSLNIPFLGDQDSGPTCRTFKDRPEIHYLTLAECKTRLRAIVDEIQGDVDKLHRIIPGPWSYKGNCVIPVISEDSA